MPLIFPAWRPTSWAHPWISLTGMHSFGKISLSADILRGFVLLRLTFAGVIVPLPARMRGGDLKCRALWRMVSYCCGDARCGFRRHYPKSGAVAGQAGGKEAFPSNEMAWKLGTDIQNMTTYTGLISKDSPLLYGYITHKATSSGMICIAICEKSLSQRKLHTRHLFPASHSLTGPLRPQNPKFERPTAQPALVLTRAPPVSCS